MLIYIIKKLFSFLILLFILTLISVSIVYFSPNSPISHLSFYQSYYDFYYQLFSYQSFALPLFQKNVYEILHQILLPSFELGLLAIICATLIGFPIGIISGLSDNSKFSHFLRLISWILYASPLIWIAILIIYVASIDWHFVQHTDYTKTISNSSLLDIFSATNSNKLAMLVDHFKPLFLPALILTIQPCIITIQIVSERVNLIANKNYIKVANIRENSSLKVLFRHLLPNALPEIIPQLTYNITTLLFSIMVIEILLNRAGVGTWLLSGFYKQDYSIIALTLLCCGIIISLLTLLSEILVVLIYSPQSRTIYE